MKKLLKASLFTAAAALALWSCDNGKYDTDPDKDNNGILNPLDPANNPVVMLGSMKGKVNGKTLVFAPAYYMVDTDGIRHVWGRVIDDSIYRRTITIVGYDSSYSGKTNAVVNGGLTYSFYDTVLKRNKYYRRDPVLADTFIYLLSGQNGTMRGMIDGPIYKQAPQPENKQDEIILDSVIFYLDKKPFAPYGNFN